MFSYFQNIFQTFHNFSLLLQLIYIYTCIMYAFSSFTFSLINIFFSLSDLCFGFGSKFIQNWPKQNILSSRCVGPFRRRTRLENIRFDYPVSGILSWCFSQKVIFFSLYFQQNIFLKVNLKKKNVFLLEISKKDYNS